MVFTPPPSQIPDDCSVDVGDTENSPTGGNGLLYDWLNSLPRGSPSNPVTVRFVQGGCYLVNGGIFVRNFHNYVFDGNGATFRQDTPPAGRHPVLYNVDTPAANYCGDATSYGRAATWTPLVPIVWWFVGGCDVTVENMKIQGPYGGSGGGGGSQQDSGIELSGVQRFTVTNNTIRNVSGDFVTVSGLWEGLVTYAGQPSTDVSIVNNTFSGAGRQGVTLGYVDRVLVTANTLTNVAATVFDIEIDTIWGNSDNIDITQNTVLGQTYAFLVAALTGTTMNNFAFTDNQMTDGAQMRVIMDPNGLNNATITGNVATDVDSSSAFMRPAIQFEDLIDGQNTAPETNILVANNTIPSSPWNHGDPIRGVATVWAGSDVSNLQVRNNSMALTYGWGVPHTYTQVLPLWQDSTSGPPSAGASTFSGSPSNGACGNSQGSVGTIYYGATCGGAYAPPPLPVAPSSPGN